jgi:hypothetical protein
MQFSLFFSPCVVSNVTLCCVPPVQLGGRFGTTSCAIASQQRNSGKLVVVEPDRDVWFILAHNQQLHRCSFWTFRGAVSHTPVVVSSAEYATRAISNPSASSPTNKAPVVVMNYFALQKAVNMSFTAILIDCEGCIEQLFALPPTHRDSSSVTNELDISEAQAKHVRTMLETVKTIIIETDMKQQTPHCQHDCVNYHKWFALFSRLGYKQTHSARDVVYSFIDHVVFSRV